MAVERRSRKRGAREAFGEVLQLPKVPEAFITALRSFISNHDAEQDAERQRRKIRRRSEVAVFAAVITSCQGDRRLQSINWFLNNMGFLRSPDQITFHDCYTKACLQLIYADEWDQHCIRVMQNLGLLELYTECLVMTPRRHGKSWAVAMWMLAMLLSVPGIVIAVFSPGSRASNSLMKLVLKFSKSIALNSGQQRAERRLVPSGKEILYVLRHELSVGLGARSDVAKRLQTQSDTAQLLCFPSSKKGTLCVLISSPAPSCSRCFTPAHLLPRLLPSRSERSRKRGCGLVELVHKAVEFGHPHIHCIRTRSSSILHCSHLPLHSQDLRLQHLLLLRHLRRPARVRLEGQCHRCEREQGQEQRQQAPAPAGAAAGQSVDDGSWRRCLLVGHRVAMRSECRECDRVRRGCCCFAATGAGSSGICGWHLVCDHLLLLLFRSIVAQVCQHGV